jgi:formylmethanofuran:tetrahydromethanopterin formyltransferase
MPEEFKVVEQYRFEGMSSTDDNSILLAIETSDGRKGVIVDAYGTYSDSLTPDMLERLRFVR